MSDELPNEITGADRCHRIQTAITIDADINEVWDTVTQSAKVGWWFAPGVIEAEGGRMQLNYADGTFGMTGDVKVLFRPYIFEFSWDAHELADETVVRFDLVPVARGVTQVSLTSLVFDDLETVYLVIATWQFMLERLKRAVAIKAEVPDDEARVAALVAEFRDRYERRNQN